MTRTIERNVLIKELLNGTMASLEKVVSLPYKILNTEALKQSFHLHFGVLIGITGQMKGKLILAGDKSVFASIGEAMFGMKVEQEMLHSFSGELGNMIAGNLSTDIITKGVKTDITAPTIMEGNTTLTGYRNGLQVTVSFSGVGELHVYLLIDEG
ncbi:MAG TPA: chemotaxis protein CheX [Cerasibacillus sp.]|uniref:chemotaxis protein CheX n=1 Tax=Cerasibacillus sp. TaxID=2498711 RepID=UPI002F3F9365